MAAKKTEIKPQFGPQEQFFRCEADILFYGGAAGGGKTWSLLAEPLRHFKNPLFSSVTFRKTTKQIRNAGGLWDEGMKLYMPMGARPVASPIHTFYFESGMRIQFSHMEQEKNMYDWQGSQIPLIQWDELNHFTRSQFFYMMSRNRSDSGVSGYIRATMNPDPKSWVKDMIRWWLDEEGEYPDYSKSGVIRYFRRVEDEIIWSDTKDHADCRSFTFIPSKLTDNQILMQRDPTYEASLRALSRVERARLLDGNWKIEPTAGEVFNTAWWTRVLAAPAAGRTVRYWDRAATEKTDANNPDRTVGLKLRWGQDGRFYILDVVKGQWSPGMVERVIKNTAIADGRDVQVWVEQDPGQAGMVEATQYVKLLPGFTVKMNPVRKDKISRALPVSAQVEAGNISVVQGPWNKDFFDETQAFPSKGHKKDQVDALSGAFAVLVSNPVGDYTSEMAEPSISSHAASLRGDPEW